jgi:hypothetical protein
MQSSLPSILAICPNHFILAVFIIFILFGFLYYVYSSSLFFILHTQLTQSRP